MEFTLRQIRYFVATADAGQISHAGAMLGVSQSAVTEAVRALEAMAGVKLMNRHSRGISLTQEGFKFLSQARRVLAVAADAERSIKSTNANLTGHLCLGVSTTVAGYFLASPLARFRRIFPNVTIALAELSRPAIESKLIDSKLDLGLLLLAQFENVECLETSTLLRSTRRVWMHPNHRLAEAPEIGFADIVKEPYLLLTVDENVKTTTQYWAKHDLQPNVTFRTGSIEAIRSLVANDSGITILSDMVYRPWSLEGDRIVARPLTDAIPLLNVGLAWRKGGPLNEAACVFRDFCIEGAQINFARFSNGPGSLRSAELLND